MRALLVLFLALTLAGCATTGLQSYVAAVPATDGEVIGADVAEHLRGVLPAANTTLVLERVSGAGGQDTVTPTLLAKLRGAGFAVVEDGNGASVPQGERVRYLVTMIGGDQSIALRLQYKGVEATRMYARSASGALVASGPFVTRVGGGQ